MRPESEDPQPIHGDARDAVTGPVGSARLVEPTTAQTLSADLDRLTPIDNPLADGLDRLTPIDAEPLNPEEPTADPQPSATTLPIER